MDNFLEDNLDTGVAVCSRRRPCARITHAGAHAVPPPEVVSAHSYPTWLILIRRPGRAISSILRCWDLDGGVAVCSQKQNKKEPDWICHRAMPMPCSSRRLKDETNLNTYCWRTRYDTYFVASMRVCSGTDGTGRDGTRSVPCPYGHTWLHSKTRCGRTEECQRHSTAGPSKRVNGKPRTVMISYPVWLQPSIDLLD